MAKLTLEERIKNQQEKIKKEQLKLEKLRVERDKNMINFLHEKGLDSVEELENYFAKIDDEKAKNEKRNNLLNEIFKLIQSHNRNVDSVEKLYTFVSQLWQG